MKSLLLFSNAPFLLKFHLYIMLKNVDLLRLVRITGVMCYLERFKGRGKKWFYIENIVLMFLMK